MLKRVTRTLIIGLTIISALLVALTSLDIYFSQSYNFAQLGRQNADLGARMSEYVIQKALSNALFTPEEFETPRYTRIPGPGPEKFHTEYDRYFDKNLSIILSAFLNADAIYYAYIVTRDGYLPVHTLPEFESLKEPGLARDGVANKPRGVSVTLKQNGERFDYTEYRSIIWVNEKPWGAFCVGIPKTLIARSVVGHVVKTAGLLALLMYGLSSLVFILIRNNLRPIKELSGITQRMAQGDLLARGSYRGEDEFGILTRQFNLMADRMQESTQDLERSVLERTHELEESRRRFSDIAFSTADWIWETDPQFRYTFAAGNVKQLMGFEPEELIGRCVFDLVRAEDRDAVAERYRTLQAERLPFSDIESWRMTRSGELICIQTSGTPILGQGNEILGYRGVNKNITDRKRAEEARQKSHQQVQRLFESLPLVIISLTPDLIVRHWNPLASQIFRIRQSAAVDKPLSDLPLPFDPEPLLSLLRECHRTRVTGHLANFQYTRGENEDGYLEIMVSPLQQTHEDSSELLVVAQEVTENKLLQSQVLHSQKMESVGQLASGIAHEINTPIQYVGDNVQFVLDSFKSLLPLLDANQEAALPGGSPLRESLAALDFDFLRSEIPKSLQQSIDGVQHVARIVRAMKAFAHPDLAQVCIPTDINHCLENTVTISRNEWKYVANLSLDLDRNLPEVSCLPGEINQVFLNLIVNAAHAIESKHKKSPNPGVKGTISISTSAEAGWVRIRIQDSGTGIPEKYRSKIFDPFFTTKEVGKGTGQGLTIAHNVITKKHKGKLEFETVIDEGTVFIISLPVGGPLPA